jgi:Chromate transporter
VHDPEPASQTREGSIVHGLLLCFLRLGTVGFGRPIALASRMESDVVAERGWIERQDYLEGLAFAQVAPGSRRLVGESPLGLDIADLLPVLARAIHRECHFRCSGGSILHV